MAEVCSVRKIIYRFRAGGRPERSARSPIWYNWAMRTPHLVMPNAALVAVTALLFSLSGCQSAAIRVVDKNTGLPVSGAKVEHGYTKYPNLVQVLITAATRKYIAIETLTADDDGGVVARGVWAGHYLFVTAPGYRQASAYYELSGWRLMVGRPEERDGSIVLPLDPKVSRVDAPAHRLARTSLLRIDSPRTPHLCVHPLFLRILLSSSSLFLCSSVSLRPSSRTPSRTANSRKRTQSSRAAEERRRMRQSSGVRSFAAPLAHLPMG